MSTKTWAGENVVTADKLWKGAKIQHPGVRQTRRTVTEVRTEALKVCVDVVDSKGQKETSEYFRTDKIFVLNYPFIIEH